LPAASSPSRTYVRMLRPCATFAARTPAPPPHGGSRSSATPAARRASCASSCARRPSFATRSRLSRRSLGRGRTRAGPTRRPRCTYATRTNRPRSSADGAVARESRRSAAMMTAATCRVRATAPDQRGADELAHGQLAQRGQPVVGDTGAGDAVAPALGVAAQVRRAALAGHRAVALVQPPPWTVSPGNVLAQSGPARSRTSGAVPATAARTDPLAPGGVGRRRLGRRRPTLLRSGAALGGSVGYAIGVRPFGLSPVGPKKSMSSSFTRSASS